VCGQERNTHRRSILGLVRDFVVEIVNFDSRLLRTARALLLQPGELPRAFREGRTQRYVPAVRLYLFMSLLFFVILSLSGIAILQLDLRVQQASWVADSAGNISIVRDGVREPLKGFKADAKGRAYVMADGKRVAVPGIVADGKTNYDLRPAAHLFAPIGAYHAGLPGNTRAYLANMKKQSLGMQNGEGGWVVRNFFAMIDKLETDPAAMNGPLTTWLPRILFLLLPLFAVLLALFYVRQRADFYFVDHLIFSLTFHSFLFAVLIAAVGLSQILSGGIVGWLTLAAICLYLLLSLRNFYAQSWLATAVKFIALTFVYSVFFLVPALIAALAASMVAG
jgi:hypothetical protein